MLLPDELVVNGELYRKIVVITTPTVVLPDKTQTNITKIVSFIDTRDLLRAVDYDSDKGYAYKCVDLENTYIVSFSTDNKIYIKSLNLVDEGYAVVKDGKWKWQNSNNLASLEGDILSFTSVPPVVVPPIVIPPVIIDDGPVSPVITGVDVEFLPQNILPFDPNRPSENGYNDITNASAIFGLTGRPETPYINIDVPEGGHGIGKPIQVKYIIPEGQRTTDKVSVQWWVDFGRKKTVLKGGFDLNISHNETTKEFSITLPDSMYGWYSITCQTYVDGKRICGSSRYFIMGAKYEGMTDLSQGQFYGTDVSTERLHMAGLPFVRCVPPSDSVGREQAITIFDDQLNRAKAKIGNNIVCLFSDNLESATEERAKFYAGKYKGMTWEIFNEPNFSMSAPDSGKLFAKLTTAMRSVDPTCKVLGPSFVQMTPSWVEDFYNNGGDIADGIAIHDYQGHESFDPIAWKRIVASLKSVVSKHGDKPLWITERVLTGIRVGNAQLNLQAIRLSLWVNFWATQGIPVEKLNPYYMDDVGFDLAAYFWGWFGPHEAILALRVRHHYIKDAKSYDVLSFGKNGDNMFVGLKYNKTDSSSVMVLQNTGLQKEQANLTLNISGDTIDISDSYGNIKSYTINGGKLSIMVPQMPIYVLLKNGQTSSVQPINFGQNVALNSLVTYTGESASDSKAITDGIIKSHHGDDQYGDVNASQMWKADFVPDKELVLTLPKQQNISRVVIYSERPDNQFGQIQSYSLQVCKINGQWITVSSKKINVPSNDPSIVNWSATQMWGDDTNIFVESFDEVECTAIKLIVHDVSSGYLMGEAEMWWRTGTYKMPKVLYVKQIEAY